MPRKRIRFFHTCIKVQSQLCSRGNLECTIQVRGDQACGAQDVTCISVMVSNPPSARPRRVRCDKGKTLNGSRSRLVSVNGWVPRGGALFRIISSKFVTSAASSAAVSIGSLLRLCRFMATYYTGCDVSMCCCLKVDKELLLRTASRMDV